MLLLLSNNLQSLLKLMDYKVKLCGRLHKQYS